MAQQRSLDTSGSFSFKIEGLSASERLNNQREAWKNTQQRMKAARDFLQCSPIDVDPLVVAIHKQLNRPMEFSTATEDASNQASDILSKLQQQIVQAQADTQAESAQLDDLQVEIQDFQAKKDQMQLAIKKVVTTMEDLSSEMEEYRKEVEDGQEALQVAQLQHHLQVPRLRHQISLFASCTGISWNFDDESCKEGGLAILSGQVVCIFCFLWCFSRSRRLDNVSLWHSFSLCNQDVRDKQMIRRFAIDPLDFSKFDLAQKLWNIMDGKDDESKEEGDDANE